MNVEKNIKKSQSRLFRDIPDQKVKNLWRGGYAATPGTGPIGKSCGGCKHKTWAVSPIHKKCALTKKEWTESASTDIKLRAPACAFWAGALIDFPEY